MTDEELIQGIKSGGRKRMLALKEIFSNPGRRKKIVKFLIERGCTAEDAEDIFQDSIIIFDKKVANGNFEQRSSIDNYLYGIAKYAWLNKFRAYQKTDDIELKEDMLVVSEASAYYERSQRSELLDRVLGLLGARCQQLLRLFSFGYSLPEIALELNFKDNVHVQKEKYRCLARLRKQMMKDPKVAHFIKRQLTTDHK